MGYVKREIDSSHSVIKACGGKAMVGPDLRRGAVAIKLYDTSMEIEYEAWSNKNQ